MGLKQGSIRRKGESGVGIKQETERYIIEAKKKERMEGIRGKGDCTA